MASTRSRGATWVEHNPLVQSYIKSCVMIRGNHYPKKLPLRSTGLSCIFSLQVSGEWCLVLMAIILLSLSAICL